VRQAYFDSPYMRIRADSPATGESYWMDCRREMLWFNDGTRFGGVRCEGGRPYGSAQVVLW
jgi:hypothetical protein